MEQTGTSFWSSDVTKNTISNAIGSFLNLGTTLIGANQQKQLFQGQANLSAQQNQTAIDIEREKTKQAQLMLETAKAGTGVKTSGNTALYIGLAVGGVVVLGGIIFAVTRK